MADSSVPDTVYHAGVRIPPPLIYIAVFGLGFLLQRYIPIDVLPSLIGRIAALCCMVASAVIGVWSFVRFWRARTSPLPMRPTTALVLTGPYRFTRNPMYLSLALVYVWLALWFTVFWAVLLLPLALVIVRYYVIAGEERYLEAKFGQEYLDYKARVRRWI
jgi:protein-S-isoprenylcysteine O-methyltransferase Ste14